MATLQDAETILRDAQAALRALLERAVAENRYADAAHIAARADGLARLIQGEPWVPPPSRGDPASTPPPRGDTTARATRPRGTTKPPPKGARGRKGSYPRFERDGDRLVKIAWSKKNKDEYAHRAPKSAVLAFAQHLAANVRPGAVFRIEDILPVPDPGTGEEIPTYQVYLTLGWLRQVGAVEKKERDAYVLRAGMSKDTVERMWATFATPK